MIEIFILFVTNLFDFLIETKYMSCFIHNRKFSRLVHIIILINSAATLTYINRFGIPLLNLVGSIIIIYIFSLQYSCILSSRFILVLIYMGIGFVVEPVGLLILQTALYFFNEYNFIDVHYIGIIICELLRFFIIKVLCYFQIEKLVKLPKNIIVLLILIPIMGIITCCLIIRLAWHNQDLENSILCLSIIMMVLFSNYIIFYIFEKFNFMIWKEHQNDLILQENKLKENYYRDIEENNKQLRKVRHDIKNQLISLYDSFENDNTSVKNEFNRIFLELDEVENTIYTNNSVLNSVLKVKFALAKNHGIKIEFSIHIPQYLNLNYGDIGVLYGNLLDNAIEACLELNTTKTFIVLKTDFIDGILMLKITNSKKPVQSHKVRTTKKDKINHGIGIKSVQKIIENYNGSIQFCDKGKVFEVSAVLYGIKLLKE